MKIQGLDGAVQPVPQVTRPPAGTLPEKEMAAKTDYLGAAPKAEWASEEAGAAKKKEEVDRQLLE